MKWFWHRTKKPEGVTAGCLVPSEGFMAAPRHASDWTGPRAPVSAPHPLADYVRQLFEAAQERNADTVELVLNQAQGLIRTRLKGSGDWQQVGGPPEYAWPDLIFTCLEIGAIETCQATIEDPVSGDQWRFTFRKESNQIQLSKMASRGTICK